MRVFTTWLFASSCAHDVTHETGDHFQHITANGPGGMGGYTKKDYIKMEYNPQPPHLRCAEVTEGSTGPGIKTGLGSDGQVRPKSRSRG